MTIRIQRRAASAVAELGHLSPLLQRIYAARQVTHPAQLDKGLQSLLLPDQLTGIAAAVALLSEAVRARQRVVIVADYDADGATSCALMVRGLRAFGVAEVSYIVPSRFDHGYGLSPELVALAAERTPDLLLTVDNGIASHAGVAAAKAAGMRVLVTDHHLPGDELPAADAIVNPNQPHCAFPSKALCGVGVAFYVLLALRAELRDQGFFSPQRPEPNLASLLDLVALGTVADLVPLDHNNRILVEQGLRRIRANRACAGINALIEVGGRTAAQLVASDLGFVVGPRLNAAGRLQDMALGVECLLCDDPERAQQMALELDKLNRQRRSKEADMQVQALAYLDEINLSGSVPFGLCLFEPSWHEGVVGILAARVKERLHRPVIAFAVDKEGQLKGSARSVAGLHIRDAIDAVAARHPQMILKYGGHAMAAGLTLAPDKLDDFRAAFDREVRRHLTSDDLCGVLWSDGELSDSELTLSVAEVIRHGGPWGQGFPEPLFDGEFQVLTSRVLKEKHLKMTVARCDGETPIEAIAFNRTELPGERIHLAYRLEVNEFRGQRRPQLLVEHIATADAP